MNYFWAAGYEEDVLCSCGAPLRQCEFWRDVVLSAYGELSDDGISELVKIEDRVARRRNALRIRFSALRDAEFRQGAREYFGSLRRMYRAVAERGASNLIVDASKEPSQAYLLREAGFEVKVLHLIRDPRAVVYSRQRKKRKLENSEGETYMPIQSTLMASVKWAGVNILSERLRANGFPYLRVRYEDLVEDPEGITRAILAFAGLPFDELSYIRGKSIHVQASHIPLGNPGKFVRGGVEVRGDFRWRSGLSWHKQMLVQLITWFLVSRYGY